MDLNQTRVNLQDTSAVTCEQCEHDVFAEAFQIRKASKILTGSTKDTMIPIPVFMCAKCKTVNREFLPKL